MTSNLIAYHREYEKAMQEPCRKKRDKMLARLMTEMEREVPLCMDEEWQKQNRKLIAMYRKVSMSRSIMMG